MILYFSGTGNSAYVANKIGEQIGDTVVNLLEKIKNHDYSEIHSDKPFVFVYPTYAWQIPRILKDWIYHTEFSGNQSAYFVATCGESMGDSDKYLEKICQDKNLQYMGCGKVVMPENYIAMFKTPDQDEAIKIVQKASTVIEKIADTIKAGKSIKKEKIGVAEKMASGIVNKAFYPMFVSAKKFYATDACVKCGKCEQVCPYNNIKLVNGTPTWGDDCTHCMACICKCPTEAIEYGKKSKGRVRYQCPLR